MSLKGYSYPEGGPPADLLVEATGGTLEEAFANAALAMFNAITPLEGVEEAEAFEVEAEGEDLPGLLFNFLDELLYMNDTELLVASSVDVELDLGRLRATAECRGERFDPGKHVPGIAIKAVTFHMMSIEERGGGWAIRVVFDT